MKQTKKSKPRRAWVPKHLQEDVHGGSVCHHSGGFLGLEATHYGVLHFANYLGLGCRRVGLRDKRFD